MWLLKIRKFLNDSHQLATRELELILEDAEIGRKTDSLACALGLAAQTGQAGRHL